MFREWGLKSCGSQAPFVEDNGVGIDSKKLRACTDFCMRVWFIRR
jgi:hypothetical protein